MEHRDDIPHVTHVIVANACAGSHHQCADEDHRVAIVFAPAYHIVLLIGRFGAIHVEQLVADARVELDANAGDELREFVLILGGAVVGAGHHVRLVYHGGEIQPLVFVLAEGIVEIASNVDVSVAFEKACAGKSACRLRRRWGQQVTYGNPSGPFWWVEWES